jgi:DNA-binding response OmpR family regulator
MKKTPLILIVDDDQAIIKLLTDLFSIEGYQILSTNWGHEAISLIEKHHPDLVIMDVLLPDINGFEVTERIRAKRGTAFTPVLFLSETAEREQRLKGLSLGAEDFIGKPFDIEELVLRVRNVLGRFAHAAQTNPVSGLPENTLLDHVLDLCLQSQPRQIIIISIFNMDQLRKEQGFLKADSIFRIIAERLEETLQAEGDAASLLGQISPHQFVLIMPEQFTTQKVDSLEESLQALMRIPDILPESDQTESILEISLKCFCQDRYQLQSAQDLRSMLKESDLGGK